MARMGGAFAKMIRILKPLIAVIALGLAGGVGYQAIIGQASDGRPDTPQEWQGRIDYKTLDREFAAMMQRPEMAGLAVAIVEDGELRFVRTYGVADRSTRAKVTVETIFRWASVSKTATGALAATLANEKALDLEQPISRWPNSLRLPQGAEAQLTLAQLLSHQTGLTKNAYDEKLEDGAAADALRGQLIRAPLQCQPGTCHTYQNVGFDAASEILGGVAQQPFDAAVSNRFFRPLGMESASYGMAGLTGAGDWARPHKMAEVRRVKDNYWRVPAAAGVNSNILDFAKWMQAMMGERPEILPASALQLARTSRVATPELYSGQLSEVLSDTGYGLGLRGLTYGGQRLYGHSGAVDGYRATMIFDPATQTGVVAMWNSNWGIPFRIPFAVFDSYYKRDEWDWLDLNDVPLPEADPIEPAPK
jgi:beta-lactamase class C